MNPADHDEAVVCELYHAARSETPDPATKEQARAALLAEARQRRDAVEASAGPRATSPGPNGRGGARGRWATPTAAAGVGLALAAAAAWLLFDRASLVHLELGPERLAAPARTTEPAPLPATSTAPGGSASSAAPTPRPSRRSAPRGPASAPRLPPPLSSEIELLDRARRALAGGEPEVALRELDAYHEELHGVRLEDEATLLEITALQRAGRSEESRALASRFVNDHPDSPLAERARKLLHPDGAVAPATPNGGNP